MSVKGFIVLLFKVEKPGYSRWLNCISHSGTIAAIEFERYSHPVHSASTGLVALIPNASD